MATYVGKIKVDGTNELPIGSTLYGTCGTAAATAAKVVTMANFDQLITGVTIHVKFTYSNTVANPTLNVNSTGAKTIYRYGTTAPSTTAKTSWNAGAVVSFTYDGTYWQMNDWLNDDTNTTTGTTYAAASVPNNTTFGTNGSILNVYNATKHTTATASLAVASWNSSNQQSATVSGVTASNLVIVSPAPASVAEWGSCGVYCSAQAANSLTFTCSKKPSAALTANVVIMS